MQLPRIMIAATKSGGGKTFLTCGILQALAQKEITVTSFKCGPDYIDPMFHEKVLECPSYNLDSFFVGTDLLTSLFVKHAAMSQISVIEGVMGYYDGIGGNTTKASSYEVAHILNVPVVLLIDCKGSSTSLVPLIKGFLEYRSDSNIKGVILNKVSPMMYPIMKQLIEAELPIKVLGYVKTLESLELESRHLGLITPMEITDFKQRFEELAKELINTINFEALLELAESAVPLESVEAEKLPDLCGIKKQDKKVRIAIAKDEAFSFHYADNLELLEKLGAIPCYFSPIHDQSLPEDICGLILNGGYPEVYAKQLEENISMRESVRGAIQGGMPTIAECGGFMYLQEQLVTLEGKCYTMVGALSGKCMQTATLQRFGYVYISAKEDGMLLPRGERTAAHEFHYFDCEKNGTDFVAVKASGTKSWSCGFSKENFYGGFPHLYYYSCPNMIQRFLGQARQWKERTYDAKE